MSFAVLGCIGAPYGIKGGVHVHSYATTADNILSYETWYLNKKGQWQAIEVLEARAQGKGFVAFFKGCESRDDAAKLTNLEFGVPREELPALAEGEYYWSDLMGMTVVTDTEVILGQVEDLLETGSNDVLVVKGDLKEHLIPYLPGEYVLSVDLKTRIIRVVWDPEF